MFIDVWDANSLHLIGTATLQLKELLRQGREAVQSTYELDIISTEYDDDSRLNSGNTVSFFTFLLFTLTVVSYFLIRNLYLIFVFFERFRQTSYQ